MDLDGEQLDLHRCTFTAAPTTQIVEYLVLKSVATAVLAEGYRYQ